MSASEQLWPKFRQSKSYREEFVAQHARQAIPFQISALLKQYDLTQAELASRAGLTQGVISRAADPSYGKLTLKTLVRIAAGFDVAFIGRFVPFSELPKWFDRLEDETFTVPSFDEEDKEERESAHLASEAGLTKPTIMKDWMREAQGNGEQPASKRAKPLEGLDGVGLSQARSSSALSSVGKNQSAPQGLEARASEATR